MKLRYFLISFILCLVVLPSAYAQEEVPRVDSLEIKEANSLAWPYLKSLQMLDSLDIANPVQYWNKHNQIGLDINEVTFMNWSAGGSNAVSVLFNANVRRTYEKGLLRWKNEFLSRYGLNAEKGHKLRKTDDNIELNSTFGYRTSEFSNWFYSAKVNMKTQLTKGFSYPDRDKAISRFMAPGYLLSGIGAEYGKDSDKFTLYISIATLKTTFVLDETLANEGAFGVEKAIYDSDGNILRKGKRNKSEFGILISNEYNTKIVENINFSNRLTLYTDYLKDFGNIDIDWKVDFHFKVNQHVAAKITSHLIYDDDTKTKRTNSMGEEVTGGAKVQWKQQLGIGLVFDI